MLWKDMAVRSAAERDQVVGAVVQLAVIIKELITEGNVINYCELVSEVLERTTVDRDWETND